MPGEVLDDALTIATAKGALRLLEVQLAGVNECELRSFYTEDHCKKERCLYKKSALPIDRAANK